MANSKHAKALAKAYSKQRARQARAGQLPSPGLDIGLDAYTSFSQALRGARRVLVLAGAGLSAGSGIATFRGAGGLWHGHRVEQLATPEAFDADPVRVWRFYEHRRRHALAARPNRGHRALARLARRMAAVTEAGGAGGAGGAAGEDAGGGAGVGAAADGDGDGDGQRAKKGGEGKGDGGSGNKPASDSASSLSFSPSFLTITQNIDGLSERAGHPAEALVPIHGSLHRIKCSNINATDPQQRCDYSRELADGEAPCAALEALSDEDEDEDEDEDNSDNTQTQPQTKQKPSGKEISVDELPRCPRCSALLRPGVVWFGEAVAAGTRERIHAWLDAEPRQVDLMLVVGTSAAVYPAAAYIHSARHQGARVAIFNTEHPQGDVLFYDDDADGSGGQRGAAGKASKDKAGKDKARRGRGLGAAAALPDDNPLTRLRDQDWFFQGSAADVLPDLLKELIGPVPDIPPPEARVASLLREEDERRREGKREGKAEGMAEGNGVAGAAAPAPAPAPAASAPATIATTATAPATTAMNNLSLEHVG